MVHGGLCLAHPDDTTTVLVAGAMPDERVEAVLRYRKGATWFADTVTVMRASPDRVTPPCPYVPECGGCQLQHTSYARQLELKVDIVRDALQCERLTSLPAIRVLGMSDPWRYRRRGEFHVVPGVAGVADSSLGFNRARSWRPIAVEDCLIHDTRIAAALPVLRDMVRQGATSRLSTLHITMGDAGGELLVRPKPSNALDQDAVERASLALPGDMHITTHSTSITWQGHTFRVSPETFMQVNVKQLDALYGTVMQSLAGAANLRVIDAYAGVGMLAVHLAVQGAHVTCVESNRAAARLGTLNARLNDVDARVEYVAEPVEHALPRVAAGRGIDALVLDPPRAGCSGQVTGWIALAGPPIVVYVSCDPATLARDLHVLVGSGPYELAGLTVVDMFPQTYHVETVAELRRRDAKQAVGGGVAPGGP